MDSLEKQKDLVGDLARVLNTHGIDSTYRYPDFVLAEYLIGQLSYSDIFAWVAVNYEGKYLEGHKSPGEVTELLRTEHLTDIAYTTEESLLSPNSTQTETTCDCDCTQTVYTCDCPDETPAITESTCQKLVKFAKNIFTKNVSE